MATSSEMAASFGYSLAFFNQSPELKALLASATSQNYSVARFVAALQNTKWFRTTSESARKYKALEIGDPATFKSRVASMEAHLLNQAGALGVALGTSYRTTLAKQALQLGWNEDQIKRVLSQWIKPDSTGHYFGAAGSAENQFREMAADYGVTISESTLRNWVRNSAMGIEDPQSFELRIKRAAMSKYTALKDRIESGETVRQIADPYMQSYGKLLEVNPQNLNLDDPLIQKALQSKDEKGQPSTQTVYDFEQTLRNDPRWAKTDNAQDTMSATANEVLKTFGLQG